METQPLKEANKTKFVVAGLLLGILMAAMDNTIVATAMATIVGDLGGFDKFVWVTSAYMVATMAGMPIFGNFLICTGGNVFILVASFFSYSVLRSAEQLQALSN